MGNDHEEIRNQWRRDLWGSHCNRRDLSNTHRKRRSAGGAEGAFQTNRVGQSGAREERGLRSGLA